MSPIKLVLDGGSAEKPKGEAAADSADSVLARVEALSPEEEAQVEQFSRSIALNNIDIVTNYGATVQKQSAGIATKTLDSVRSSGTGEISGLLVQLVSAIDEMENGSGRGGAFASFFDKMRVTSSPAMTGESAERTLERIEKQLIGHKLVLQKDIIMLDAIFEENLETYKALTMYIKAGERALERARLTQLEPLRARADATGSAEDRMNADMLSSMCDQFDMQLQQLRLTRTICMQSAPQIMLIRQNDRNMLMKLQSSIVNTIPLWRKKIAMSAAMENSAKAAEAAGAMDELTNRMLRAQASLFRKAVTQTAQTAQRDTIDAETIEFVNKEITGAVLDYIAIEQKGASDRQSAVGVMSESKERLNAGA